MKELFKIALVDDEASFLDTFKVRMEHQLSEILGDKEISVEIKTFTSAPLLLYYLEKHERFDLIFLDIEMPELSGIEAINRIKIIAPQTEVIMVSGHGDVNYIVQTMKYQASDYLLKPVTDDKLKETLKKAVQKIGIGEQDEELLRSAQLIARAIPIIGQSQTLQQMLVKVARYAKSDSGVLILGESGSGKELIAKALHQFSKRNDKSFIDVNITTIPENLMESELFGHEKGAFTGAIAQKKGLFERANGGTLFLDEIGDMPFHLQVKLLRALQEGVIRRVHGTENIKVDVRVIAATNQNIPKKIQEGKFRDDLFYRLNILTIHVPSLKERKEDVPLLIDYFLKKLRNKNDMPKKMSAEATILLTNFSFLGNIRQLKNIIERLINLAEGETIQMEDVKVALEDEISHKENESPLDNSTRQMVLESLARHRFNKKKVAEDLNICRNTVYRYIREFEIVEPSAMQL